MFQPGAKHINFYICTGKDPSRDVGTPLKFRGIMFALFTFSALVHIIIPIKIELYKRKIVNSETISVQVNNSSVIREKDSLLDLSINFAHLVAFAFGLLFILLVSKINPYEIGYTWNTILIYIYNIFLPSFTVFLLSFTYYVRHTEIFHSLRRVLCSSEIVST